MLLILCLLSVASAEQITHFKIDYGTYTIPATMTEDDSGKKIVFSSTSDRARIDTIVVDYNTMTLVVRKERQSACYIADITPEIQSIVQTYRQLIHTSEIIQGKKLYYSYTHSKPTNQSPLKQQLLDDFCTQHDVSYVTFTGASTTPKGHRHWCILCLQG